MHSITDSDAQAFSSTVRDATSMNFINWRAVPKPDGKTDKIPTCGNALNPANWLTFEQAYARDPHHVAIVLTDGLACLDVDDAIVDGQWTPIAHRVLSLFPDCATEISQSGRGLHVFMHTGALDVTRYMNRPLGAGYEFYPGDRFIALGRGLQGDWVGGRSAWGTDAGSRLAAFLTPRPASAAPGAAAGVLPPYVTDEMIVGRITEQRTVNAALGRKAPPADLWAGVARADVLATFYPDGRGGFDHSRADAALLSHLAFWCWRDAGAMDRLFRQSGLMREKWDRATAGSTYGAISIAAAVTGCKNVAKWDAATPGVVLAPGEAPDNPIVTASNLPFAFPGCTFVKRLDRILTPDGELCDEHKFKSAFGGKEWPYRQDKWTRNAWEAFTHNQLHTFPKVRDTCFKPDLPFGAIVDDAVNTYVDCRITPVVGDVTPFLRHLEIVLPDAGDRHILLQWLAANVQFPGRLIRWAPVLVGPQGNGKTLIADMLGKILGERYVATPRPKQLSSDFNGYVYERLLAVVEEICIPSDKRDLLDVLKPLVTNETIEVRIMRTDAFYATNTCNWFFCTNREGGLIKDRDDRRYAVFHTADRIMPDAYFRDLSAWLKNGGCAAVAAFLASYDVSSIPSRAPDTSSTADAIEASYGKGEQFVLEAIAEERRGLCAGWASSHVVSKVLVENGMNSVAPKTIKDILKHLGFARVGRPTTPIAEEGMSRPVIYARSDTDAVGDWFSKYYVAQKYGRVPSQAPRLATDNYGVTTQ